MDVAVFVPFTCLHEVSRMAEDTPVIAGAQNFYYEDWGAFTGEVSVPMLQDAEAGIVGHSERREHFCEDDDMVARKAARAVEAGLLPVVCVGETKEERDAGDMWEKVSGQVRRVMEELDDPDGGSLVFAYEPIWAIGTGDGHARGRAGRDRPHSGSAQGAQGRRVRRWGSYPLRRLRQTGERIGDHGPGRR